MSLRSTLGEMHAADFEPRICLPVLLALALCLANLISGSDARAASATEPKGVESMRALALELLRAQDYDRSIAVYREIARQTPNDARSHYDLAAALSFVQRYEEAAPPIHAAIRLRPDDLEAQEMASLIFLKLRWYEQAFEATLRSAELGEPTAMFSLVNLYEKGLGVTANADKAVYWAIKAAEHGHLGAMALLEDAFRNGRLGRHIDEEKAEMWAKRLREAKSAQK
ncbi:MAG TPA: tetratricopeptide repeat protein [Gammaproteobacteria bacterium]|nr:tetratricopeptide repeat protein [Gammaproteobacteria bacterium]